MSAERKPRVAKTSAETKSTKTTATAKPKAVRARKPKAAAITPEQVAERATTSGRTVPATTPSPTGSAPSASSRPRSEPKPARRCQTRLWHVPDSSLTPPVRFGHVLRDNCSSEGERFCCDEGSDVCRSLRSEDGTKTPLVLLGCADALDRARSGRPADFPLRPR